MKVGLCILQLKERKYAENNFNRQFTFFKKYKEEIDYEFRIISSSIRKIKGRANFTEKL